MKLSIIYEDLEDNIKNALGLAYIKKLSDPGRLSTLDHKRQQPRSGNQDTPMKPRHRKFFNAPIGGVQGKTGYNGTNKSKRPLPSNSEDDYPKDKNELDKELEKKAREQFGHLAVSGPRPKLKL